MTIIHCRECGHKISTKATYCPHCGASPHKISMESEIRLIILLIIMVIGMVIANRIPAIRNLYTQNWAKKDSIFSFPVASLQINYSQSYKPLPDRIAVAGEVKNIDPNVLPDVEAIVKWYDKSGILVATDTDRIQAQPLMPGRSSTFEVISVYEDGMVDYQLSFRTLAGGDIAVISKR